MIDEQEAKELRDILEIAYVVAVTIGVFVLAIIAGLYFIW